MPLAMTGARYRPRTVRNQTKISKFARVRTRFLGFVAVVFLFTVALALLRTWFNIQLVNLGYSINRQIELKEELVQKNKILTFEIQKLKSLTHIEEIAKNEFEMNMPAKGQIIYLSQLQAQPGEFNLAQLLRTEEPSPPVVPVPQVKKPTGASKEKIKVAKNTKNESAKGKTELKIAVKSKQESKLAIPATILKKRM